MSRHEVSGTVCFNDGCTRQRIKGSVMCNSCTTQRYHRTAGPNKTSDGRIPGGRRRKLTDEQVVELRRMWSEFTPVTEIAAHFNVSVKCVRETLKRSRSGS